jgi:hypothetical protein
LSPVATARLGSRTIMQAVLLSGRLSGFDRIDSTRPWVEIKHAVTQGDPGARNGDVRSEGAAMGDGQPENAGYGKRPV